MNNRELLGVSVGASPEEIQAAFRREALKNHPDVSASPEAAEAFMRIKEARDTLMREAAEGPRVIDESIQRATDDAVKATAAAAYTTTSSQQQHTNTIDDIYAGMTKEQIAYIQELDRLVRQNTSRFSRRHESDDVRRHRNTLKTRDDRLSGRY